MRPPYLILRQWAGRAGGLASQTPPPCFKQVCPPQAGIHFHSPGLKPSPLREQLQQFIVTCLIRFLHGKVVKCCRETVVAELSWILEPANRCSETSCRVWSQIALPILPREHRIFNWLQPESHFQWPSTPPPPGFSRGLFSLGSAREAWLPGSRAPNHGRQLLSAYAQDLQHQVAHRRVQPRLRLGLQIRVVEVFERLQDDRRYQRPVGSAKGRVFARGPSRLGRQLSGTVNVARWDADAAALSGGVGKATGMVPAQHGRVADPEFPRRATVDPIEPLCYNGCMDSGPAIPKSGQFGSLAPCPAR